MANTTLQQNFSLVYIDEKGLRITAFISRLVLTVFCHSIQVCVTERKLLVIWILFDRMISCL